ncbi:MAG: ACR3 family arsenite efflux transporter [Gammaproteobacteria bacterium]
MGIFERWLTLWVLLCMVVGVGVGHFNPTVIHSLGNIEIAKVNIPVAILIWLMIIPMLISIDLKELVHVKQYWRGIYITLIINWLVKPFSMAFLGWIFLKHVFSDLLPPDQIDSYIAGLIILAAAPCTAMVFVWSNLCKGEPHFTLTQVALNDLIMIFAFAPIVGLLLGITNISVPWATLFYSVLIYIIIPFCIAQYARWLLIRNNSEMLSTVLKTLHPVSLIALLSMLILLFSFQGEALLKEPLVVFIIAIPILIQVYFNSMLAYYLNKITGEAFCVAGPSALIGASNFFELAVATAIILFGFKSGAALATVVGVLVEVPVMLSIVKIVNATKYWYKK